MPTRNAAGAGSIRQRKDGTWEGRCTVGRDPGDGHQIQKSVYGKTQQEVRRKLSKATASIRAGDDPKTVSGNLGHASVAFTLDVYGHVTGDMKKDSSDRMQEYIEKLKK